MTWETADKPGSVVALGRTRHDRQPFLWARGRPRALATYPQARPSRPDEARPLRGAALAYLVLLRMEVAAFHPSGFEARGLVSVALFVTSPCQGVTLHPALRSPDFPPRTNARRLPGRLPLAILRLEAEPINPGLRPGGGP